MQFPVRPMFVALAIASSVACSATVEDSSSMEATSGVTAVPSEIRKVFFTAAPVDGPTDRVLPLRHAQAIVVELFACATGGDLRKARDESWNRARGCLGDPSTPPVARLNYADYREAFAAVLARPEMGAARQHYPDLNAFEESELSTAWWKGRYWIDGSQSLGAFSHDFDVQLEPNPLFDSLFAAAFEVPKPTTPRRVSRCKASGTVKADRWNYFKKQTIDFPIPMPRGFSDADKFSSRNFPDRVVLTMTEWPSKPITANTKTDYEAFDARYARFAPEISAEEQHRLTCDVAKAHVAEVCARLSSSPASAGGNWFFDTSTCAVPTCECTDYEWNRTTAQWEQK